ncbi:putative leucine-rich repeat-containing protein DDB_G0290503 [Chironomus tepperi]|uniref:putative leucine-rich repeat-containing protein DDB_G0290503 n=1 Tax=Chironomus tepperi TaxID=113505 RepID=UPI00391FBB04
MSETLTVDSLRRHLPFLNKIISHMRGTPFVKEFENMRNVIDCGKQLSPNQVRIIETSIANLKKRINDSISSSTSGSAKKNKNNKMEVICISSDDEATSSDLPFHKEREVVQIKTVELKSLSNQSQEVIVKPENPDVEIIMTKIQTNSNIADTNSQKITIKPERCEVETIIKEVKLTTDYNGNSQLNNSNITDPSSAKVKEEEESESDIEDYKTVCSSSSEHNITNNIPEPFSTQNDDDDDDEIIRPIVKRKRRKISSSSEISNPETSKSERKRRRIIHNSEPSDDDNKSQKASSTSSHKRKKNKSNSSSGSEFYSAESVKSVEPPANESNQDDLNTLEHFRSTVRSLAENENTTDTTKIVDIVKSISKTELPKLVMFLRKCWMSGLLNLDIKTDSRRTDENILNDFVKQTLNPIKQLRSRVVISNEKDEVLPEMESSEDEVLDFSDDEDNLFNKNNKTPTKTKKSKNTKKVQRKRRARELNALRNDIDNSFIKPALLTLKPREHKKVDYRIDNKASSSDDSEDFVNSISKNKQESVKKRKGRKRLVVESNQPKEAEDKANESDESEIGRRRPLRVKRLEDLDSDRTTPDNLVGKPIEPLKNEELNDNRATPDIDLENDPRVVSMKFKLESKIDEDIDTECSSGETVLISPQHEELPDKDNAENSSDDDEDESNPKYHFITVEKILGARVYANKLNVVYKPEPYKVSFENGAWKILNLTKTVAKDPVPNVSTKTLVEDRENPLNTTTVPDLPLNNSTPASKDEITYDPILSDDDFAVMDNNSSTEVTDQNEKLVDSTPNDIPADSSNSLKIEISEEKYKIQETNFYDPISSDSDDDALCIDLDDETNKKVDGKKSNTKNEEVDHQHPVIKKETENTNIIKIKSVESGSQGIIIIDDSDDIVPDCNIKEESSEIGPQIVKSVSENNQKSTLKDQNSISSTEAVKPSTTQNTVLQQTPQKNALPNKLRKCSPMSKLLTENERKIFNLSYISCRGGHQFRCLNSCKYYNLKEENFKNHILSKHLMDNWSGFCNLCGKSFHKEARPLIDEYEHMITYHINPDHERRSSIKENIEDNQNDSDCIVLSQGTESDSNVPKPIVIKKNEDEVAVNVSTVGMSSDNLKEDESKRDASNLSQQQNKDSSNTNTVPNGKEVQQNIENPPEDPTKKLTLRIKMLPGDKLSGRNDGSSSSEKSLYTVQENISNRMTPPMTPLPESCVPETTPEKEATLQAVIGEIISKYPELGVEQQQQQQPGNVIASSTLTSSIQPNSIILHSTTNAIVTYTPPSVSYNGDKNNVSTTNLSMLSHLLAPKPSGVVLPNQLNSFRPTASIAPTPKNNYNGVVNSISNTVSSNNLQNSNTYLTAGTTNIDHNTKTTNVIPLQRPSIHAVVPINSSSLNICRTRRLRPWLDVDDMKCYSVISECLNLKYLGQLYKCMLVRCSFATDNPKNFYDHLLWHQRIAINPLFDCCYCTYGTLNADHLVSHITEKYRQCKYYCSRCFYRTSSQYNALQHILLHNNSFKTKLFNIGNIPPIMEDQEFEKIQLRELPPLKCITCPQVFQMYDQFISHINQCCINTYNIKCTECKKTDLISKLEEHQTKCYGIYTYNCCYCPYGTQKLNEMSYHMVHIHQEKIPFYIERCDTSHLSSPMLKKAACIKKFTSTK